MKQLIGFLSFYFFSFVIFGQGVELVTQEKNLGSITVLDYNSEGTLLASGSEGDNSVKIWDVRSGRVVGVLSGHRGHIVDLDFHPNGNELVSVDAEGSVFIWDIQSWQYKDSLYYQYKVLSVSFSNDGKYVIGGTEDKKVLFWTIGADKPAEILDEHKAEVVQISVDGESGWIASGSVAGDVKIWGSDLAFKVENRLHRRKLSGLKFVNKGNTVVSSAGDGKVIFWNAQTLEKENELNAHSSPILAFDVNEKSGFIATSASDKKLKIWKMSDLSLYHIFENGNALTYEAEIHEPIQTLALSPNGDALATSSYKTSFFTKEIKSKDNIIRIWNLKRKNLYKTLEGNSTEVTSFTFHPHFNKVVTLTSGNRVTLWDLNKAEDVWSDTLHPPKLHSIKMIDQDEEGGKFKKGLKKFMDGDIGVLDIKDNVETRTVGALKRMIKEHPILKYSEKGKYFITALPKDEIRIYKTKTDGSFVYYSYVNHEQEFVNDIMTDPEEKYLFCLGSGSESVTVVDIEKKEKVRKLSTPTPLGRFEHFFEGKSLTLSPDGKYLAISFVTGKVYVYDLQTWSLVFENEFPNDSQVKIVHGAFANFTEDGSKLMVNEYDGINVYTVTEFKKVKETPLKADGDGVNLNKPVDFAVVKSFDELHFEFFETDKIVTYRPIVSEWITHIEVNNKNLVGVSLRNGEFKFIDPVTGKEMISLIGEDDNYIFKTPENYYKVSKEGFNLVTFRIGQEAFPFEQFDIKYNRPDKVLEALRCDDEHLIQMYRRAYDKRLTKLDISESSLSNEVHVPELTLINRDVIPLFTTDTTLTLDLKAIDDKYALKRLNVWINNVPVFGRNGKTISGKEWKEKVTIPLGAGLNKIQISVANEKMSESLYEFIDLDVQNEVKPNLYLLAIGTSEFSDSRYNLSYAAKDAHDLVNLFKQENDIYNQYHYKTLTNEEVIKDDFMALKEFLKGAQINDVIIVFLAGHGLLSADLDYYYATHDVDFMQPQMRGVEYTKIEYILENVLTLKKILIMDTCHSGEVDKDDVSLDESEYDTNDGEDDIAFRNVGPALVDTKVSPSKLSRELFTDVRKGTGATVISSAGGAEFAMESGEWKNGLFTYSLLNGLINRTADLNKDGVITLSELQKYLKEKVSRLSHGRQVPTTRVQNYSLDYAIW